MKLSGRHRTLDADITPYVRLAMAGHRGQFFALIYILCREQRRDRRQRSKMTRTYLKIV
jgi:hypothetical protein